VVPQQSLGSSATYEVVFESQPYGFGITPDVHGRNGIIGKVGGTQTRDVRIGSRIMSINGQSVENRPHTEILNVLKKAKFPVRITFLNNGKLPTVSKTGRKAKALQDEQYCDKQKNSIKSGQFREKVSQSNNPIPNTQQHRMMGMKTDKTDQAKQTVVLPAVSSIDSMELDEPMAESPIEVNSSPPISPDTSNKRDPPSQKSNSQSQKKLSVEESKSNKDALDDDEVYISSPSLSALSDHQSTPAKKKASKKSKKRAKKKRASDTDDKANQRALVILVRAVKQALKSHKLAREDFKVIAKKCSNKLLSNYKRKGGRKRDPKVWASKRKPKIKALVAKYVKLQLG